VREIKYNKAGRRIGKYKKVNASTRQAAIKKVYGAKTKVKHLPLGYVKKQSKGIVQAKNPRKLKKTNGMFGYGYYINGRKKK
jgi:hypothetical protein